MNWVHTLAVIVHVLLAVGIVGLVLLQRGRGADAGAGFGAGASGTVFGARGSASFLSRMTATMAALFFVTSLALAYLGGQRTTPVSILDSAPVSIPNTVELPAPPVQSEPADGAAAAPADESTGSTTGGSGDAAETAPAPAVSEPSPESGG